MQLLRSLSTMILPSILSQHQLLSFNLLTLSSSSLSIISSFQFANAQQQQDPSTVTDDEVKLPDSPTKILFALSGGLPHEKIEALLIENPKLVSVVNEYGEGVLHVSSISPKTQLKTIKLLLEYLKNPLYNDGNYHHTDSDTDNTLSKFNIPYSPNYLTIPDKNNGYSRSPIMWWLYQSENKERDRIIEIMIKEGGGNPYLKAEDGTSAVDQAESIKGLEYLAGRMKEWYSGAGDEL